VVICLEEGTDCLHVVQLMPLLHKTPSSHAPFKSRMVLPFWYQLAQVVLEKRPLSGCSSCVVFLYQDYTRLINCMGNICDKISLDLEKELCDGSFIHFQYSREKVYAFFSDFKKSLISRFYCNIIYGSATVPYKL